MNAVNHYADVWAGYMFHGIIETALLLGFVSVIYFLFKKKISSHFAYWLFLFVIIKLLCPVEIRVPQWMTYFSASHSVTTAVEWAAQPLNLPSAIVEDIINPKAEVETIPPPVMINKQPQVQTDAAATASLSASPVVKITQNTILMGCWSFVVVILFAGFLINQWRTLRWVRRTVSTHPDVTNPLYTELLQSLCFKKRIPLYESEELNSPVAVGLWNPRLFVPAGFFQDLTRKQASWILFHELMHVQRYDLWIVTLQRLVQIVFFFNPAVWIANWAVNQFREYACDDAAIAICNTTRRDCGEGLLTVLERIHQIPSPMIASLGLLQPYSVIRKRLERILDSRRLVQPRLSIAAAGLLVLIGITVLPYVKAVESSSAVSPYKMMMINDTPDASAYMVNGTIIDAETKQPVPGAEVCLYFKRDFNLQDGRKLSQKTTADSDGRFSFSNVVSDIYYPVVFSNRYQPYHPNNYQTLEDPNGEVRLSNANPNPSITLALQKGHCAKVKVLSPDGVPLTGAKVAIFAENLDYYFFTAQTGASGEASFANLPGSKVFALAQMPGFGDCAGEFFIPGTDSGPAEEKLQLTKPSVISCKVIDKEGNGISGLIITLHNLNIPRLNAAENAVKHVTTGNDGKYRFTDLGTGTYRLSENNPDPTKTLWCKVIASTDINLKEGTEFTAPDRVIEKITPSQPVRVQVVSTKGKPLPQAHVNIYPDINELSKPGSLSPLTTSWGAVKRVSDDGTIELTGFYPFKKFDIQVLLDGYNQTGKKGKQGDYFPFEYKNDVYKVVMQQEGGIQGCVKDKITSKPIPNATVSVNQITSMFEMNEFCVSSSDGVYAVPNLISGKYAITVQADGYPKQTIQNIPVEDEKITDNVDIRLENGFSANGSIRNASGDPLAGVDICLKSNCMLSGEGQIGFFKPLKLIPSAKSNPDGSFTVPDIPKAGDTIITEASGYAPACFTITPSNNQNVNLTLRKGSSIHGMVCNNAGTPVIAGKIQVFNFPDNTFTYEIYTDDTGHYKIENLPQEKFYLRYSFMPPEPGMAMSQSFIRQVALKEEEDVLINMGTVPVQETKEKSLTGTVYDANNQPMPAAKIRLVDPVTQGQMGTSFEDVTKTDSNGKFAFFDVPAGEYLLIYYNPHKDYRYDMFPTASATVKVTIGTAPAVQDIHEKISKVSFKTIDGKTGSPLSGVTIYKLSEINKSSSYQTNFIGGQTDDNGLMTLQPQMSGLYNAVAWKEGYFPKNFQFTVPDAPTDKGIETKVSLTPSKTKITAAFTDYNPSAGDKVRFHAVKDNYLYSLTSQLQNGQYSLSGCPDGTISIFAIVTDENNPIQFAAYPKTVTIHDGDTLHLGFDLTKSILCRINCKTPQGEILPGKIQISADQYPTLPLMPLNLVHDNQIDAILPAGDYAATLLINGYKPITFNLKENAAPLKAGVENEMVMNVQVEKN